MSYRDDFYTNTADDAGRWERMQEDGYEDDRPTAADLEDARSYPLRSDLLLSIIDPAHFATVATTNDLPF